MNEWERCKHWISDALEYARGTYTLDDVKNAIEAGRLQFWPGKHAAIVTEIVAYPRLKELNFFLAGGDLEELKTMEPMICEWAEKTQGCRRSFAGGRSGFARFCESAGYQPLWRLYVKEFAV